MKVILHILIVNLYVWLTYNLSFSQKMWVINHQYIWVINLILKLIKIIELKIINIYMNHYSQ